MEDINRLKVVLAEKRHLPGGACRLPKYEYYRNKLLTFEAVGRRDTLKKVMNAKNDKKDKDTKNDKDETIINNKKQRQPWESR